MRFLQSDKAEKDMIIWNYCKEFNESLHEYNEFIDNEIEKHNSGTTDIKECIRVLMDRGLDDGEFDKYIVESLLIEPIKIVLKCTNDRPRFLIDTKHLPKEFRLETDQVYALIKQLPVDYRKLVRKEFDCPTKYDDVLDEGIINLNHEQFKNAANEIDLRTEYTIIGCLDATAEECAEGGEQRSKILQDLLTLRHISGKEMNDCFKMPSYSDDNNLWVKEFWENYHSHPHYFTSHEGNILDEIFQDEIVSHYLKKHKLETTTQASVSCDSSHVLKGKKAFDLINELIGNWIDKYATQNYCNGFVMSFFKKILIDNIEDPLSKKIVDDLLGNRSKLYRYRELDVMVFCKKIGFLMHKDVLMGKVTDIAKEIHSIAYPNDSDNAQKKSIRPYIQQGIDSDETKDYRYMSQIIEKMSKT